MSEVKCQLFPSGTSSWHVWEAGAKEGDPCQCGQLPYVECHKQLGKYDGTTMREVLEWASEHVWRIEPDRKDGSGWFCISGPGKSNDAPTLYAALHSAWEARDK